MGAACRRDFDCSDGLTTTAHLQAPEPLQWWPVVLLLLLLLVTAGLLSPHEQAADTVACDMQLLQVWQRALQDSHLHGQHTAWTGEMC